jgi:glycosyltransferase involved in cell wall biosynthesis
MSALGLSARARKARELGKRALSMALARPRMILPGAHYPPRAPDGILVLQRGENPSTDYYLRPRLVSFAGPTEIADLASDPAASKLLAPGGGRALTVVICRYASSAWLEALQGARDRLARVAFFMDDDLPEMMRSRDIPAAARGKVALNFAAHAERLEAVCSEIWVSTPTLAERYPETRARILSPLPDAEPPPPVADVSPIVVYHGTDVHEREQRFVLEIASRSPEADFEIIGDAELVRRAARLGNVRVTPQLPWPDYRKAQLGRQAAISLAPLFASALNDARAPVKAIDAARLGAAGLFADAPAYGSHVRDGVDGLILPMKPSAWAAAIGALLADPQRRLRLAQAARERQIQNLAEDPGLPAAAAE